MIGFNGGVIGAKRTTAGLAPGVWTLAEQALARRAGEWLVADPDADAYIKAVQAADGESLEASTIIAIDRFVLGCKADGIWSSINACCILAGARTRTGALIPLKGSAPTSYNFVDSDYNRKTGLLGDGSTKYLDSNTPHSNSGQNNAHLAVWASSALTSGTRAYAGAYSGSVTSLGQDTNTPSSTWIVHDTGSSVPRFTDSGTGLKGVSRSASGSFVRHTNGSNTTVTRTASATAPGANNYFIFARSSGTQLPVEYGNCRLSFYSIGSSLDLAVLRPRVDTLIADIAAAF